MIRPNNIVVFVPVYNPKIFHYKIYKSFLENDFSLFLQINSSVSKKINFKIDKLKLLGAHINNLNKNIGISKPLNLLIEGKSTETSHVFFLDQDTFINVNLFINFINKKSTLIINNSLMYLYNNSKNSQLFITNSGSLINLNKLKFKFNIRYFVELIDYWLVVKLYEEGSSVLKVKVDFLNHEIFQEKMNKIFKYEYKSYSTTRFIEIFKNTFFMSIEIVFSLKLNFIMKFTFLTNLLKNLFNISFQFFISKIHIK